MAAQKNPNGKLFKNCIDNLYKRNDTCATATLQVKEQWYLHRSSPLFIYVSYRKLTCSLNFADQQSQSFKARLLRFFSPTHPHHGSHGLRQELIRPRPAGPARAPRTHAPTARSPGQYRKEGPPAWAEPDARHPRNPRGTARPDGPGRLGLTRTSRA